MTDTIFAKSKGVTTSERLLATLCERSFLKLWSYPNPIRGQRSGPSHSEGKELCDVFVPFGNDLILFSDKSCKFPESGDVALDWARWFRRTILKSIDQLSGAERWIRTYPKRIYLDRACTCAIPDILPNPESMRIHHVVVASGATERCQRQHGGAGTFYLDSRLTGNVDLDASRMSSAPFRIGSPYFGTNVVHVFDEVSIQDVLRELDTIGDLVEYLTKRERFLQTAHLDGTSTERDLLACNLTNLDQSERHSFEGNGYTLGSNTWNRWIKSNAYGYRARENKLSYLWDAIIEEFSEHLWNRTLEEGANVQIEEIEPALRQMASEPRVSRRFLAKRFIEIQQIAPSDKIAFRTIIPQTGNHLYVFVLVPEGQVPDDEYRQRRREIVSNYCILAGYKNRKRNPIVGIGTELRPRDGVSHDLMYILNDQWTPEMEAEARLGLSKSGWLRPGNLSFKTATEYEYGNFDTSNRSVNSKYDVVQKRERQGRIPRNEPCPCGSGRKAKRCCAREY